MDHDAADNGLTVNQLVVLAWVFAAGAGGSLIRLLLYANPEGPRADVPMMLTWSLAGVLAGLAAAACSVVAGVKAAERRLRTRDDQPEI